MSAENTTAQSGGVNDKRSEEDAFERQYRSSGFDSQRRYPNEHLIAFIAGNYFSLPRNKRKKVNILELGCGSGANLWFLAHEGFDAYGIDTAPTGIRFCRSMLKAWGVEAEIAVGDMRKLTFPDGFFDAVVDVVSLQHVSFEEHPAVLAEVFRCLKKGGKFFVYHLGENSISYLHGGGKIVSRNTIDNITDPTKPLHGNGLTCFLSANEARTLLQGAGFAEIMVDTVSRTYNDQEFSMEYLVMRAVKP